MFTDEGIATVTEVMRRRQEAEQDGTQLGFLSFETQHRCKDGRLLWGEVFSKPDRDEHGTIIGYHGITREITERKRMQDEVQQLALYDSLTKLPNRHLLNDRLDQALAANRRKACYGALMFIDLDNFKPLNDEHGHFAGDLVLIEVADRLKNCVRKMDTVARFGGDEFVVVLTELNVDKAKSKSQAEAVAKNICSALSATYSVKLKREGEAEVSIEHHCSASIGVVLFSDHAGNQDDILIWADKAMYQAKDAGRNAIRFYEAEAS